MEVLIGFPGRNLEGEVSVARMTENAAEISAVAESRDRGEYHVGRIPKLSAGSVINLAMGVDAQYLTALQENDRNVKSRALEGVYVSLRLLLGVIGPRAGLNYLLPPESDADRDVLLRKFDRLEAITVDLEKLAADSKQLVDDVNAALDGVASEHHWPEKGYRLGGDPVEYKPEEKRRSKVAEYAVASGLLTLGGAGIYAMTTK
jgi:hypothetical protein